MAKVAVYSWCLSTVRFSNLYAAPIRVIGLIIFIHTVDLRSYWGPASLAAGHNSIEIFYWLTRLCIFS